MLVRAERFLLDGRVFAGGLKLWGLIPGEVAEVSPEGRVLKILEPSPWRQAGCRLARRCPGCQWQHVSPEGQEFFKKQFLKETLGQEPQKFWQSPAYGWRWRVKLLAKRTGDMIYIGFPVKRRLIFDLWSCPLLPEPLNALLERVKWVLKEEGVSVYNPDLNWGKLVAVELAGSPDPPGLVVGLHTRLPVRSRLLGRKLAEAFPELTGVAEVLHEKVLGLWGETHYRIRVGETIYRMSPGKPWTDNPYLHRALSEAVLEAIYPGEPVFEAGAAQFFVGLSVARKAKNVLSADPSPWDFSDGPGSLALNAVGNVELTHDQIKDFTEKENFTVYLVNADRDPLDSETAEALAKSGARQVFIFGENLEFLSRVDQWMKEAGFKRAQIQAFDPAPGTPRILTLLVYAR